jgi:hypothetical protein
MTVDELKKVLNVTTDKELACLFKRSKGQISKWRSVEYGSGYGHY